MATSARRTNVLSLVAQRFLLRKLFGLGNSPLFKSIFRSDPGTPKPLLLRAYDFGYPNQIALIASFPLFETPRRLIVEIPRPPIYVEKVQSKRPEIHQLTAESTKLSQFCTQKTTKNDLVH